MCAEAPPAVHFAAVSDAAPPYAAFLGTWLLIPESCRFEQGAPPRSGTERIVRNRERLRFELSWVDASGVAEGAVFEGVPDGKPEPFAGSDLADTLVVHAVSARELTTSAFYQGKERMVAQRQLDDTGAAMRLVQVVRFPDGETLANISVYRRAVSGPG